MELSEEQFMEITGVRVGTPIYSAGSEKRGHTRVSFGERARIYPLMEMESGNGSPVLVRDLSRSGVGFQINDELTVGDEFVLQLRKQSGEVIHLQSIVQRCEVGGTGLVQFVVGATFELVLTEAQWKPPKAAPQVRPVPMSRKQAVAAAKAISAAGEDEASESTKLRSRLSDLGGKNAVLAEVPESDGPVLLVETAPAVSEEQLAAARSKLFAPASAESASTEASDVESTEAQAAKPAAPTQKARIKPLPPLEPLPAEQAQPAAESKPAETAVASPAADAPQVETPKLVESESKQNVEAEVLIDEAEELVESDESMPAVVPMVIQPAPVKAIAIEPTPAALAKAAAPLPPAAVAVPAVQVVAPIATITPVAGSSSPMLVLVVPTGSLPAGQQSITVNAGGFTVTVSFAAVSAPAVAQPAVEFTPGESADSMFDLLAESLGDESVDIKAA